VLDDEVISGSVPYSKHFPVSGTNTFVVLFGQDGCANCGQMSAVTVTVTPPSCPWVPTGLTTWNYQLKFLDIADWIHAGFWTPQGKVGTCSLSSTDGKEPYSIRKLCNCGMPSGFDFFSDLTKVNPFTTVSHQEYNACLQMYRDVAEDGTVLRTYKVPPTLCTTCTTGK
jgi:hypothetical protein